MKIAAAILLALLPPFAAAQSINLVNPGFEQKPAAGETIPGWRGHQHAGEPSYEFALDSEVVAKGKASFRMKRLLEQDYGALDQIVPASTLVGKEVEFSALVRTRDVGKRGFVLCVNVIDRTGGVREQFRSKPRTTGTNDEWTRLSVRAKVSSGTRDIEVGFLLIDGGTIWADEATLKVVEPGAPDEEGAKTKVPEKTETDGKPPAPEAAPGDAGKKAEKKPDRKADRKAKEAAKAAAAAEAKK